jgi:hypothetical protein
MNLRRTLLYSILGIILLINLQQWIQWEQTVPRYNLDNSTVSSSGRDMLNVFLANPLGLIASPGWGSKGQQVFSILFLSLLLIVGLWVLQGGRTVRQPVMFGPATVTVYHPQLRNFLHGMKPIDCSLQTLIWILVTVPAALIFIATGATLNYFWDFTNNVPFYPWHFAAHFLFAYSIVSVWACLDIEETFSCNYRWKALTLLGLINIFSLYLENTENLMIIQGGLHAWMFNNLPDSRFDIIAVLLGGLVSLVAYNSIQYRE